MAISTGAAILGGTILGGAMQSRSTSKASKEQAKADAAAIAEERRQFDQTRQDLAPWRDAGSAAVGRLTGMLGLNGGAGDLNQRFTVADFWNDPVTTLGYDAGLKEGTTSLDRSFGARGMLKSGAAAKALTRFGQDYAGGKAGDAYNRFYGDQDRRFNRLSGIAGTGQTAANSTVAAGNASTGRVSDILTSGGNARGAAAIARGNAFAGGMNTVGNFWAQNEMLDKLINSRTPFYGVGGAPY